MGRAEARKGINTGDKDKNLESVRESSRRASPSPSSSTRATRAKTSTDPSSPPSTAALQRPLPLVK